MQPRLLNDVAFTFYRHDGEIQAVGAVRHTDGKWGTCQLFCILYSTRSTWNGSVRELYFE
jgi:hypothetical protein